MSAVGSTSAHSLRDDTRGAVLAMGLLFTLFCVGLTFAIVGIHEAVEHREALQNTADAAALAAAMDYADAMNSLSKDSDEMWNYLQAALYYQLAMAVPDPAIVPAPGFTAVGPCGTLNAAGQSVCLAPFREALRRAAQINATFGTNPTYTRLLRPRSGLAPQARGAAAQLATRSPYARSAVAVDLLDTPTLGPGQMNVVSCARLNPAGIAVPVGWEYLSPPGQRATNPAGAPLAATVQDGILVRVNKQIAFVNVGRVNASTPPYLPLYSANGSAITTAAFPLLNSLGSGVGVWRGVPIPARGFGPGANQWCVPVARRDARAFRLTARASSARDVKALFRASRALVFAGAFEDNGGRTRASSGDARFSDDYDMEFAGSYALAQASFGLRGRVLNPARTPWNAGQPTAGAAVVSRIAQERAPPRARVPWSTRPIFLMGEWGANLTRVHVSATDAQLAPNCNGCTNPAPWMVKFAPAMVH